MSAPGLDPRVLDALQNASSLELFQLSTLIERKRPAIPPLRSTA